jgi:hypothetical protein
MLGIELASVGHTPAAHDLGVVGPRVLAPQATQFSEGVVP